MSRRRDSSSRAMVLLALSAVMTGALGLGLAGARADEPLPVAPRPPEGHYGPAHGWHADIVVDVPVPNVLPRPEPQPAFESELTLSQAVGRALNNNPSVGAALAEIEARHGEAAQSVVHQNPELTIDVENFARSKSQQGATETTFSLAQTLELGGKRWMRLRAAQLDASLAVWDYEAARMQVGAATARTFVDVLTAQDRLKVLQDFVTIASKTRDSVDLRVKGGKASPIELDRAIVVAARAKALVKSEKVRLEASKRRLALYWGAEAADFGRAAGRLGKRNGVPSLASLKEAIEVNPSLARWSDEVGRRLAQLDVELSKTVPDVKVGAGIRHFAEDDAVAAVASVSVPLPVFNRNIGNIAAAENRIVKAERDRDAARNELLGGLTDALGALEVAAAQVSAFESDVLPPAESAFERTKIGYAEGKFDILNVLEAQRAVFEARLDLLTARADYEKARVNLEALAGRDLGGL